MILRFLDLPRAAPRGTGEGSAPSPRRRAGFLSVAQALRTSSGEGDSQRHGFLLRPPSPVLSPYLAALGRVHGSVVSPSGEPSRRSRPLSA